MMSGMATEDQIDALYSLPLEDFTAERNALAKELKEAGDKDAAASVKKLAKPTLSAWVVNQLARREPELMQELISIQDRLADPSSASKLRELTGKRRELVTALKRAAGSVLEAGGHGSGSTLQQVSQTLLAGATEEEQQLLAQGRLTRDLSSSGLEQVWGLEAVDPGETDEQQEAERKARAEAEHATKQAAEAQQRASQLATEAERLKTSAEEAERAATAAREEAERLEDAAAAARRAAGLDR